MAESIRELADRFEPIIRGAFLDAVGRAKSAIAQDALAKAIGAGDIELALGLLGIRDDTFPALEAALRESRDSFNSIVGDLFLDAGSQAALALAYLFDRDLAGTSLDRLRAELITTITTESAKAVRESLARSMRGTIRPEIIAARVKDSIGLTSNQARSVAVLTDALETAASKAQLQAARIVAAETQRSPASNLKALDGILTPQKIRNLSASQRAIVRNAITSGTLTATFIDELIEKQNRQLLRHRSLAIAGTVGTQFSNAGQHEAWIQGRQNGNIGDGARRFWITAGDERVRANHRVVPTINAAGVALNQPFQTPLGPTMFPPLEIACRCRVILRDAGE